MAKANVSAAATATATPVATTAKADTAPKAALVMVPGFITGTTVLHSVDADAAETKALTIAKGKTADGKGVYQAFCDGKSGKVVGTLVSAINSLLLDALLVLPRAWVIPTKDSDVNFPVIGDNKAPEPKELSDLSATRQGELIDAANTLESGLGAFRGAEKATREAVRGFAQALRGFRFDFNKAEWAIFAKLPQADSALGKLLAPANKNAVSEFVAVAGVPDSLFDLVPEGKNSPKAILAWVNGMRNDIAQAIVETIKGDAALAATSFSAAVKEVVADHVAVIAKGAASPIGVITAESQELLAIHWENIRDTEQWVDVDAASGMIPLKADKVNVTKAVFGTDDRADELVAALARCYNGYKDAATKAAETETKAKVKELSAVVSGVATMTADDLARHLFNILAGRLDETTDETLAASCEFADIVCDKLAGWVMAVGAQSMTVADVLATDIPAAEKPANEDDAEQDGDATA